MTNYSIILTAILFTNGALAADVYHGLADGNSDLSWDRPQATERMGVQPGIGDRIDVYRGLASGNADLFHTVGDDQGGGVRPDIYQGFAGSPDLSY